MKQRMITALILILIMIPAIYMGGIFWKSLVTVIGIGAAFEWQRMNQRKITDFDSLLSLFCVIFMIHSQTILAKFSFSIHLTHFIFLLMVLLLAETIWVESFHIQDAGYTFIGTLYIGLGTMSAVITRELSLALLLYLIIIITMTDTGAYLIGSKIGKNKLAPKISPNKTIEGSIGGVIIATMLSLLFVNFFPIPKLFLPPIFMSILLSVFGQLGDLILSGVKRHFNVKDTGSLLPGHGGLLDRFDSLLFGLSVLWIFGR